MPREVCTSPFRIPASRKRLYVSNLTTSQSSLSLPALPQSHALSLANRTLLDWEEMDRMGLEVTSIMDFAQLRWFNHNDMQITATQGR